jgi:hypothetical protein
MKDLEKQGETITVPTEEEQEAITGGRVAPNPRHGFGEGDGFDFRKHDRRCRPKFDPGGPPQVF